MGTTTYTPLANITLGSSAASVTFSSISQAYRDLVLVVKPIASTGTNMLIRFNSDSGSNYYRLGMYGDGSSTGSFSETNTEVRSGAYSYPDTTANFQDILNIMDYSATDKHKTTLSRLGIASAGVETYATRWANTAAITSIAFTLSSGTYSAGSSFALYGIAA
jgi:hypothetical protein